jgi:hypothetical protein
MTRKIVQKEKNGTILLRKQSIPRLEPAPKNLAGHPGSFVVVIFETMFLSRLFQKTSRFEGLANE